MKYVKTILPVVFFIFTTTFSMGQFSKIASEDINGNNLDKAEKLAEKLMQGMESKNYYLLSGNEAIPAVVKGLNKQTQEAVYKQVHEQFGNYKGLEFVEAMKSDNDQDYTMYRFKGTFSGITQGPEIRVVLDHDQKLAGFWILPWEDEVKSSQP